MPSDSAREKHPIQQVAESGPNWVSFEIYDANGFVGERGLYME